MARAGADIATPGDSLREQERAFRVQFCGRAVRPSGAVVMPRSIRNFEVSDEMVVVFVSTCLNLADILSPEDRATAILGNRLVI